MRQKFYAKILDTWSDVLLLARVPLVTLLILIAGPWAMRESPMFRNTLLLTDVVGEWWLHWWQLAALTLATFSASTIAILQWRVVYANYNSRYFAKNDPLALVTHTPAAPVTAAPAPAELPPGHLWWYIDQSSDLPVLGEWMRSLYLLWLISTCSLPLCAQGFTRKTSYDPIVSQNVLPDTALSVLLICCHLLLAWQLARSVIASWMIRKICECIRIDRWIEKRLPRLAGPRQRQLLWLRLTWNLLATELILLVFWRLSRSSSPSDGLVSSVFDALGIATAISFGIAVGLLLLLCVTLVGNQFVASFICESSFLPWDAGDLSASTTTRLVARISGSLSVCKSVAVELLVKRDWFPSYGFFISRHQDGRIYRVVDQDSPAQNVFLSPGHRALVIAVIGLNIAYVAGAILYDPSRDSFISNVLTPAVFLVLVLSMVSMTLGLIAFVVDRYRFPPLVFVSCWVFFVYVVSFDRCHRFETKKLDDLRPQLTAQQRTAEFHEKENAALKRSEKRGMRNIVVTAPGGGIHAAAWTARVLTGLYEEVPEFIEHISDISAVSGGSVGTMFLLAEWDRLLNRPTDQEVIRKICLEINRNAQASSLEAVGYGVAYNELLWSFAPFFGITSDSGRQQEKFWSRLLLQSRGIKADKARTFLEGFTLRNWGSKTDSSDAFDTPRIVFNATEVETGRRVQFSNREFLAIGDNIDGSTARDFLAVMGGAIDVSFITAARMSATFPFVTPVAEPDVNAGAGRYHRNVGFLGDGGYADNQGMTTAIQAINELYDLHPNQNVLLLRIIHEPQRPADKTIPIAQLDRFLRPTVGPMETVFNTRVASQAEHSDMDVSMLKSFAKLVDGSLTEVEVKFKNPTLNEQGVPEKMVLSWKLTANEQAKYDKAWDRIKGTVINQVKEFLNSK